MSHGQLCFQPLTLDKADGPCPTFAPFVLLDVLVSGQMRGPWRDALLSFSWEMLLFVSITVAHEEVGKCH